MSGQTYFARPGVASVTWDETSKTVLVVWDGWANTAEFRAILDAEIRALHEHEGSLLLADCRLQRVLNPADEERANEDWIPRAMAAGLRQFAVVLPVSDLAAARIQERLTAVPGSGFRVRYFSTLEDARRWLEPKPAADRSIP